MKKLYHAEVIGEFVFVVDTDKVSADRAFDEAYKYLSSSEINLDLDQVNKIESRGDIPSNWNWSKPLGAETDEDCESYFVGMEEAERIKMGLEELGYELEDSFVDDIRGLLKDSY